MLPANDKYIICSVVIMTQTLQFFCDNFEQTKMASDLQMRPFN